MKKKIIYIEDVRDVYEQVEKAVYDEFGEDNVEIVSLNSENAAKQFFDQEHGALSLIIVDMMLVYDHDEDAEIPSEILREGSFDAGLRMIRSLRKSPAWQGVPIAVYSSVDKATIETRLREESLGDIKVFQKGHTAGPLLQFVQAVTGLEKIER